VVTAEARGESVVGIGWDDSWPRAEQVALFWISRTGARSGQQRAVPCRPGIPAVTAGWIVLAVPKMIVHLALQRGLHHHLGQPAQSPVWDGCVRRAG
jgi:hypothetical protein